MKKFILIWLVIILSKLSFVCADSEQLKYFAGKIIYREVPAKNVVEFSKEYMNEPYELFSYNEAIMELKDSDEKSIILKRSLWDDGNWKECKGIDRQKHFSVGDNVKTINEYNENFKTPTSGKIVSVRSSFPIYNEIATLDNGKMLDTDWLEKDNTETTAERTVLGLIDCISIWYVGMEVCDVLEGRGTVVEISKKKDDSYPVKVKLDKEKISSMRATYTLGGAYLVGQVCRLYPTKKQKIVFDFDKLFPKKK